MADYNRFLGTAVAVAQVDTIQITGDDAATTYTITIGGVAVSAAGTGTGVNDTASDLKDALTASTHPYFTAITWTVATDTVTATAAVAGCPSVSASSVAGGAGTIGAVTNTTASAGPNHWDTVTNWSKGSIPANDEDVRLADCAVNICWSLAQSGVEVDSIEQEQSHTGRIGLDYKKFATSADGETTVSTAEEYRDVYLDIECAGGTAAGEGVRLGTHAGPTARTGSDRIMLDLGDVETLVEVHNTAATSADAGRPAVRLLLNQANTDVHVRSAPGGVGIAMDDPTETSTLDNVVVESQSAGTQVFVGEGVTLAGWEQRGGTNRLSVAATIAAVTTHAGQLTTEGDFTITLMTNNGALLFPNHRKEGGNAVTTAALNAGITDATQSMWARTWATTTPRKGAVLKYDPDILTLTTLNDTDGEMTRSWD